MAGCDGALPGTGGPNGTDPSGTTPSSTTETVPCTAVVIDFEPASGALSVPVDVEVVVGFNEAVPPRGELSIAVSGATGVTELAEDGLSATWISDTDLEVDTTYTVDVAVCGSVASSTFTTAGPPVEEIDVEGNSYALEWASLTFTEPPAGGAIIANNVSIDDVLLQFVSIDDVAGSADVAFAVSEDDPAGDPRPYCSSLVEETGDFSANPQFTFGPQNVEVPAVVSKGQVLSTTIIEDLTLDFEVSKDGTQLLNPALTGLLATEDVASGPCEKAWEVLLVGGSCVKCTVSDSGLCLLVEASGTTADEIAGYDLVGECAP